jgi:hypothetical protein
MKCANEIIALRERANVEYEMEQRQLDDLCRQEYATIITNTVRFCNEIVDGKLTERAKDREPLKVSIILTPINCDRLNHRLVRYISPDGTYANGDTAHCYARGWGYLDIDVLCDYLKKHCYSVSVVTSQTRIYGLGLKDTLTLDVSVPKNLPCN